MDLNRGLIIGGGRESLFFFGGNSSVLRNHGCSNTPHSFNGKRKWGYVQEKNIFYIPLHYSSLNSSSCSNYLIRINSFVRLFVKKTFYSFLNSGHSGLSTH